MSRLVPALLALCLVAAGPVMAADTITLTSQYGPGKPQTLFWEHFVERLEAERPGRFEPRIVVGGALGGEKEEAEGVRLGSITGALSTVANLTTWVPLGAVLDLPFEFEDADHVVRTMDGPLGAVLKEEYRAQGFEVPAFIIFGARHLLGSKPFLVPADVEGVTMRVLESDLHVSLWRSLGATPTALPITEAYGALSNGVVGAMDMTKSGYEALKLYEVAPILSETAHIWAIGVVYFDANWWDRLSDEDRAAVEEASLEAADYFNEIAAAEQDAAMMRTIEKGAKLVAVDQAPWRKALGDFAAEYAAGLDDPQAIEALAAIENAR